MSKNILFWTLWNQSYSPHSKSHSPHVASGEWVGQCCARWYLPASSHPNSGTDTPSTSASKVAIALNNPNSFSNYTNFSSLSHFTYLELNVFIWSFSNLSPELSVKVRPVFWHDLNLSKVFFSFTAKCRSVIRGRRSDWNEDE